MLFAPKPYIYREKSFSLTVIEQDLAGLTESEDFRQN